MLLDPTAEGKDERKAKLHVTVGNLIAADANRLEEALQYISKGVAYQLYLMLTIARALYCTKWVGYRKPRRNLKRRFAATQTMPALTLISDWCSIRLE